MTARTVATVLGCLVVAAMLALAVAGYAQEPERIAAAQPLPACTDLDECPLPSEVAALLDAAGAYGPGDYPPCVEVRAGGAVCVMAAEMLPQ